MGFICFKLTPLYFIPIDMLGSDIVSANYHNNWTAVLHALFQRLLFQLTYTVRSFFLTRIPVNRLPRIPVSRLTRIPVSSLSPSALEA